MTEVFLGIGSNLGESFNIVKRAIKKISQLQSVKNLKVSSYYKTAPISDIPQNDYLNLVCSVETDCEDPFLFLSWLQKIEKSLGKELKPKNAPRLIDIDILLYKDLYIQHEDLEVPHPKMLSRLFVLKPLQELKKEILYPLSKKERIKIEIEVLLRKLQKQQVKKVSFSK